eukprot:CAMPEP_0197599446 /NCGR_PEP_ID=MMETSP1326-20131121/31398_1 /TAXON_ID=1155430 /ORGANISM="Genus nov. species nov., Strain RCC2288" /LENGTH=32 /DNA_ID= /DNA_START= /DNA_END= /DNA_ORIENTATION=
MAAEADLVRAEAAELRRMWLLTTEYEGEKCAV